MSGKTVAVDGTVKPEGGAGGVGVVGGAVGVVVGGVVGGAVGGVVVPVVPVFAVPVAVLGTA